MVSMRECETRGEDYLASFPLFFPLWIIGNTVVWPANCLKGQPAPHWSNNLLSGDMLKGRPSLSAVRSGLLCNCKAQGLR